MRQIVLSTATALLLTSVASEAAILSNGTGGGVFSDNATWDGGVKPASSQDWTIVSGDTVTTTGTISLQANATATVQGTLSMGTGHHLNVGSSGGANVIVDGGSIATERLFSNGANADSTVRLAIYDGTMTVTNRVLLTNSNSDSTTVNSFTMTGGTLDGTAANNGFSLWGADQADRANFSIVGNAGTFNFGTKGVILYRAVPDAEGSATDINFTFGSDVGDGALTVVQSGNLTLGSNAFTIDFTNAQRPASATNYSTTLFDYSGTLTGMFGTLTSIGLGNGESASLALDTTNKLIRVDYTLAAVPEPASLCLLGLVGAAGLRRRRV